MTKESIAAELHERLKDLQRATAIIAVVVLGLVCFVFLDSRSKSDALHKQTTHVNRVLCEYRRGLEKRAQLTRVYLKENDKKMNRGLFVFARTQVENQEQSIKTLSGLDCSTP